MPAAVPAFVAFHAELQADYPPAFADSAYLLRRIASGERLFGGSAVLRFAVVARAARQSWRRVVEPAPARKVDVLVIHVPDRADYYPLLCPVAAELERRGTLVTQLTPSTGWPQAAPAAWRRAQGNYGQLKRHEARFAARWGLTDEGRLELTTVLRTQAYDAARTASALEASAAKVGVAIHTKLEPGVLTGFRETGVPLLLMQHGVFSGAWPEHDFMGSSLLLAWGPYFSDELASFEGPTPPSTVVGNPRLEGLLVDRSAHGKRGGAVYFGTNYAEDVDRRALRLVAEALRGLDGPPTLYRPHPSEGKEKYQELVADGIIRAEQLATSGDSYDLVSGAGVVLGSQTTLLLEAAAIGVPALQVLPDDVPVDWAKRGLPHASAKEDVGSMVRAALHDGAYAADLVRAARPLTQAMFSEPRGAAMRSARAVEAALTGVSSPTVPGAVRA
ncbi:MAG TPA: hypothetical protein VFN07_04260 [Trueperaceae bacterium]|nr:hypothetical protein [Trueperaceae bacterium]